MVRRRLWALALCAGSATTSLARAETRCDGSRPLVRVEISAENWSDAQRARVLADLQHGLKAQGIDVCEQLQNPQSAPLATLKIQVSGKTKASVEILLQDSVTHKRVARDLDLDRIPADSRELAVAIEADELLRASWAELALDTERARSAKPRPEVVKSVRQVLTPARVAEPTQLEARGAAEHFFGGITLIGAEAAGRVPLGARFHLELSGGVRLGPGEAAPHGSVSALAAGGATRLLLRVAGDQRASLHLGAGLGVFRLEFRGEATSGASASTYADWLTTANGGVLGRFALGRVLGLSAGVNAAATLRGVEATDEGRVAAAARGFALGATLGLEAR